MLGEVLAHSSGQCFSSSLRTVVFGPLGMTECVVIPSGRAVTSYDPDGKRSESSEDVQKGASSAACSAHALIQFAMFSLKDHPVGAHRILSDAAIDEMQTRTVGADGGQKYGYRCLVNPVQPRHR